MKATNVGKSLKEEYKPTEVEGKPCCECSKPLKAPWARVGDKWVCSRSCHDLYQYKQQGIDNNVATVHRLTAG